MISFVRSILIGFVVCLSVGSAMMDGALLSPSPGIVPDCPKDNFGGGGPVLSPFFETDRTIILPESTTATLWRSIDGAQTWQVAHQLDSPYRYFFYPIIAPQARPTGLHIYSPVQKDIGSYWLIPYLTHSSDSGLTWEAPWQNYQVECWLAATNEEGTIFANCTTLYPGDLGVSDGIHRSTDHGHTWQHVWIETAAWEAAAPSPDYANDQTIYTVRRALWPDTGVYPMISTDGGLNWEDIAPGLCPEDSGSNVHKIVVSPHFATDRIVFGQANGHLLKSEDGGASWQGIYPQDGDPCQYPSDPVREFALSPEYATDQTIFMRVDSGFYISYDDGHHWRQLLDTKQIINIRVRGRPAQNNWFTYLPLLLSDPGHGSQSSHRLYFPMIAGSGTLPRSLPFTIVAEEHVGKPYGYVRSDDGGITWRCLNLPSPSSGGSSP